MVYFYVILNIFIVLFSNSILYVGMNQIIWDSMGENLSSEVCKQLRCSMISAFVINTAYQAVLTLIVFKLLCLSLPNFPSSFAVLFLT